MNLARRDRNINDKSHINVCGVQIFSTNIATNKKCIRNNNAKFFFMNELSVNSPTSFVKKGTNIKYSIMPFLVLIISWALVYFGL